MISISPMQSIMSKISSTLTAKCAKSKNFFFTFSERHWAYPCRLIKPYLALLANKIKKSVARAAKKQRGPGRTIP